MIRNEEHSKETQVFTGWRWLPDLQAREDREVDLVLHVVHDLLALLVGAAHALAVEDHGTTRAPEGLVGRCSHDICIVEGRWHHTCMQHRE